MLSVAVELIKILWIPFDSAIATVILKNIKI
jgi:hypothetical protein